jgi:hypothetical protein
MRSGPEEDGMAREAEGLDWNDGVGSVGDAVKAVWFTDHDGNSINISAGEM